MSSSVMMQPFPEFPQIPRSQTLPEATLERKVFMLERCVERLENDFSQRLFDIEGQREQLKRQMDFIQEQNANILGEQIQLSTRIELVRRAVGEHARQHAATKEELDEIYEDMKIREKSISSYREAVMEATDYCSHVEKDAHNLRYEMRDVIFIVEGLAKDLKNIKETVSQIFLKNNKHAYLIGGTMERMDDLENALKRTSGALEGIRELKEKMERHMEKVETCESQVDSSDSDTGDYYTRYSDPDYHSDTDSDNYMAGLRAYIENVDSDDSIEPLAEQIKLPIAPSLSSDIYEQQFPSL
jgi:chromosome segregation ATPase